MEETTNKTKKIVIISATGAVVIAAAVLITVFLVLPKSSGKIIVIYNSTPPQVSSAVESSLSPSDLPEEELAPAAPEPLIYVKDGMVYFASGENTKCIGGYRGMAGCYSLQTELSGDKRYLFYLTGYDIYKGYGTLMRISTDAMSAPETIAQKVCSVKTSYDGKQVLYYTDMKGAIGTLHLWREGRSELVAENVSVSNISPRGIYISFVVDSGNQQSLYLKKEYSEPTIIKTITTFAASNELERDRISIGALNDRGKLSFSLSTKDDYYGPSYVFADGVITEEESGNERIEATFVTKNNYLYSIWDTSGFSNKHYLLYKESGSQPITLSEEFDYAGFADDNITVNEKRFLLAEEVTEYGDIKLYEQYLNGEKTYIADAYGYAELNPQFDCVVYEKKDGLYISNKIDNKWIEKFVSKIIFDERNNSNLFECFDNSGDYFYYYDYQNNGAINKYSVRTGEINKIIDRTKNLFFLDKSVYALSTKGIAYRIDESGKAEKIGTGINDIIQANGGVYLLTDYNNGKIIFIADGTNEAKMVDKFLFTEGNNAIEMHAPLGEDTDEALDILSEEIDYCINVLNNSTDIYQEPLSVSESQALIEKLLTRSDIDSEQKDLLKLIKEGFSSYKLWFESDEIQIASALAKLQKASDAYELYKYGPVDESNDCID